MIKFILSLLAITVISTASFADTTYVDEDGDITLNGKIVTVGIDEFTIMNNDERIDVSMADINEEVLENLIDSGIIKRDVFVSVRGSLKDDVVGSDIVAKSIRLYE